MICNTPKEILFEIKRYMDINDIQVKELAIRMSKTQQAVSQVFNYGNPKLSTLFEICEALNLKIDFNLICKESDTN